jgi:hypothetical protein
MVAQARRQWRPSRNKRRRRRSGPGPDQTCCVRYPSVLLYGLAFGRGHRIGRCSGAWMLLITERLRGRPRFCNAVVTPARWTQLCLDG